MSTVLLVVFVTVAMIALTAFDVAAELATVSARKAKIQQQAAAGNRFATMLVPIIEDSQQVDTAIAASQPGIAATRQMAQPGPLDLQALISNPV